MPQTSSRRPRVSKPASLTRRRPAETGSNPGGSADPQDVSRYVADICGELSKMTKSAKLMMLSYLLGMAGQEAERISRGDSVLK